MVLTEVARGLCLWVSIYTRFLKEGSDVHLWAQFLSPFHWFFSWQFSFFSCNTWLIKPSTPMSKRYSVRVHLLNPLPVPFVFYIFVNGDGKLVAFWPTQLFFRTALDFSCGWSRDPANSQFSPLLATRAHALASENMDLQVVGCMDRTRLRNEIETKKYFFNSFYSGNCQNTEISVCTFQFYESPYKYGRTFTHALLSGFFFKWPWLTNADTAVLKQTWPR